MYKPLILSLLILFFYATNAVPVHLAGTVVNSAEEPVAGCQIRLLQGKLSAISDSQGSFILSDVDVSVQKNRGFVKSSFHIDNNTIYISSECKLRKVDLFDLRGKQYKLFVSHKSSESPYSYSAKLSSSLSNGVFILQIHYGTAISRHKLVLPSGLAKSRQQYRLLKAANPNYMACKDTIQIIHSQYVTRLVPIRNCIDSLQIAIGDSSTLTSIVFMGSSLADHGIDIDRIRRELNVVSAERFWAAGAGTPYYYAKLWGIFNRPTPPKLVFLVGYQDLATNPHFWLEPHRLQEVYEIIGNNQDLKSTVDSVLLRTRNCKAWDFDGCVDSGFLPLINNVAKKSGVKLVLAQYRSKQFASDPVSEGIVSANYRRKSATYCDKSSIEYLDYTDNPEITLSDFYDFEHYNRFGRAIWTKQIISDMRALALNKRAPNQGNRIPDTAKTAEIIFPQNGDTVFTGSILTLKGTGTEPFTWSYAAIESGIGETKIGEGNNLNFVVPTKINNKSLFRIYLWGAKGKISIVCRAKSDTSLNRPPSVTIGIDTSVYFTDTLYLKAAVSDDIRSEPLSYSWEIIQGPTATFGSQNEPATWAFFHSTGLAQLRFTVGDGEYYSCATRLVSITNTSRIEIKWPTSKTVCYAGDTLHVRWNSYGINNVLIAYSLDSGKIWSEPISSIAAKDPRWADYIWVTPSDSQTFLCARIKIADYDQTVQAVSGCFQIKSKQ